MQVPSLEVQGESEEKAAQGPDEYTQSSEKRKTTAGTARAACSDRSIAFGIEGVECNRNDQSENPRKQKIL